MKKMFSILFLSILINIPMLAQLTLAKNNVYGEVLGLTGYYSINYERFIYNRKNIRIATSLGAYHIEYKNVEWLSFPVRLNLLVGKNKWYGEIGYSELLTWEKVKSFRGYWLNAGFEHYPLIHIGARYQGHKNGLLLKAYIFPLPINTIGFLDYLPLIAHYGKWKEFFAAKKAGRKVVWWGGIGIGYAF
jgi:hypothetical protein